jgi:hypothetical protein
MTISEAQLHALEDGILDLTGDDRSLYEPVKLDDIANTLAVVAAKYAEEIANAMDRKDVSSSGKGQDSINILDVEIMGGLYSVSIEAYKYLTYVDEGVDGWEKSRGSRFKFKTKGVKANSDHVKAMKEWLLREGKISRNMKYSPITKRESKQQSITDATTKEAMRAAYMVKRFGIKPKKFMESARSKMEKYVEKEFAMAIKVDIINNLS